MSNCEHPEHSYTCQAHCSSSNLYQTLDEMEFERGIWNAAQYGEVEKIKKFLIKEGIDPDLKDTAGYTALHYAARNGHLNICQLLLQYGANIDSITKSGKATALHRACSSGKTDIVKYLIEKKADCKLKDDDGKTALHRAAEIQNKEICEILLTACPEVKTQVDNKGNLPIDYVKEDNLLLSFF